MAEINERPSKIRKLDPSEDAESAPIFSKPEDETIESAEQFQSEPTERASEQAEDGQTQTEESPRLSKSQLKKLKKAEVWAAGKDYRKAKRREKHKEKQARKAEERAELQGKIANGEIKSSNLLVSENGKAKRTTRPIQVPVTLIMDCDFNELMTEKELKSLGAQLTRCYSENRSAMYRTHLVVSSWGGVLRSRFETVLANTHLQWRGVRFYGEDFERAAKAEDEVMRAPGGGKLVGVLNKATIKGLLNDRDNPAIATHGPMDALDQEPTTINANVGNTQGATEFKVEPVTSSNSAPQPGQLQPEESLVQSSNPQAANPVPSIVYLTSDSPHTLTELAPYTSYIIGGIVDKNRHKGLCYKRALERGIPTAKLPIGEYMTMQSRSVLAINHVVEIMLKWLETGDWGEAFLSVIPKRKEAKLKQKKDENDIKGDDVEEWYDQDDGDDGDHGRASLMKSTRSSSEGE